MAAFSNIMASYDLGATRLVYLRCPRTGVVEFTCIPISCAHLVVPQREVDCGTHVDHQPARWQPVYAHEPEWLTPFKTSASPFVHEFTMNRSMRSNHDMRGLRFESHRATPTDSGGQLIETEVAAAVTGLQPGAAYDLYVVAEDSASNLQAAPAKLDAATAGDDLVAWWKMNENSGTVAADSSGNSRNATLGSAVTWDAAGRSGAALSFNGSNTTANRATFTSPANPGRLLTVSGWFKAASIASGSYPRLLSTPAYEILLVGSGVSGNTMCLAYAHQRGSAADSWRTPTNSVPVGEWVHIAVVHDATSTSTTPMIYLNGVAATLTKANNGSGNLPATFEGASHLGNRAAGDRGFHGLLDDWRIHHRLLAPAEIPALPATVFAGWVAGQSGAGSLTGPNDDPDGDGVVNLLEYALGGSPGPDDTIRLPVAATHQTAPGESYLSLNIRRNANAKDVGYIVEVSGDLVTWTGGASATTVLMDTPESLVVRDNTPLENAPRRFIRLRVESNR